MPWPGTAWRRARARSPAGLPRAASWLPTAALREMPSWPFSERHLAPTDDFYGGASALPNEAGVGVRLLAADGARLRRGLEAAWQRGAARPLRRSARAPAEVSRLDYSTLSICVRAKFEPT